MPHRRVLTENDREMADVDAVGSCCKQRTSRYMAFGMAKGHLRVFWRIPQACMSQLLVAIRKPTCHNDINQKRGNSLCRLGFTKDYPTRRHIRTATGPLWDDTAQGSTSVCRAKGRWY